LYSVSGPRIERASFNAKQRWTSKKKSKGYGAPLWADLGFSETYDIHCTSHSTFKPSRRCCIVARMRMRTAVTVAIVLAITIAVCWFALREPEPAYKGRSLSSWVEAYGHGEERPESGEAIQQIGTNAFPLLLQWIREPEPQRHPLLVRIVGVFPRRLRPKWAFEGHVSRPNQAAFAFRPLGSKASPVASELSGLGANQTNVEAAVLALMALAFMGSNGVPVLLSAVRDASHPYRDAALFALGRNEDLGPHKDLVVSELIGRLDDAAVADSAATALMMLKQRPDLVLPALGRRLENTNITSKSRVIAADCLISFGHHAAPYITNALNDPDPAVRQAVLQGINHFRSVNE
jgi:HEAT repeat protein